jgi:hypothetical protein
MYNQNMPLIMFPVWNDREKVKCEESREFWHLQYRQREPEIRLTTIAILPVPTDDCHLELHIEQYAGLGEN